MALDRTAQSLHRSARGVRQPGPPVARRSFARPGAPVGREALVRRRLPSRLPGRCHAAVLAEGRSACRRASSVAAPAAKPSGAAEEARLPASRRCRSAVVAGSLALALVGAMIAPKPVAPAVGAPVEVPPVPAAQLFDKAGGDVVQGNVAQGEAALTQVETKVADRTDRPNRRCRSCHGARRGDNAPASVWAKKNQAAEGRRREVASGAGDQYVPAPVRQAIDKATRLVGVDGAYLMVVAARESRFDPEARAHRTSAMGLYQFTTATWLRAVKMFGARHGLGGYAALITIDDDGLVSMPRGADRRDLLRLRKDPELAALMAAELARDNTQRLERILGRTVTPAETYMAHLFGVMPAARIIGAAHSAPDVSGADLLPTAAHTNPHVFSAAGAPASAGDIVTRIGADFKHRAAQVNASMRLSVTG
jgi:hypothetical protein